MRSSRIMIAQLALAAALSSLPKGTEPEEREPLRDDLPPRKPPAPPPPGVRDLLPTEPAPRRLVRRYEDPNPPGHNGKRAMERRLRQQQRAAEKAARKKP